MKDITYQAENHEKKPFTVQYIFKMIGYHFWSQPKQENMSYEIPQLLSGESFYNFYAPARSFYNQVCRSARVLVLQLVRPLVSPSVVGRSVSHSVGWSVDQSVG